VSAIRFDHIAIALPRMADAMPFLVGELGGVPSFGMPSGPYTFGQWKFEGGGRIELLEPLGANGFLHRFIERHGSGIHHVTFKVPSLRETCDRAAARGYEIVGYRDDNPYWKEAFLHPRQALGIVVQLAQTARFEGRPRGWDTAPPMPPGPPAPVRVLGLRMRARSRERALGQWRDLLQGEVIERDATLVFRWPPSPMRIAVDVDAAAEEGPLAIEIAAERAVALPEGRHPVLGARFSRAAAS
jgi:methylmalonyl-CoA/ethylmalonyl-CoA epimerase